LGGGGRRGQYAMARMRGVCDAARVVVARVRYAVRRDCPYARRRSDPDTGP